MGASSMVGRCLMQLLESKGVNAIAYSRNASETRSFHVHRTYQAPSTEVIKSWISVMPIWDLPGYFDWLEAQGPRKIVAVSSTSISTKEGSADSAERALAAALQTAEALLQGWAESKGIEWVILRPTLIYKWGEDKNLTEVVRFRRRFGFFPIVGKGSGLRQPIHAQDVSKACLQALESAQAVNKAYVISGSRVLSYREMVACTLSDAGNPGHLVSLPRWLVSGLLQCARLLPRYQHLSIGMADRMDRDMAFDHTEAVRDFGFDPGGARRLVSRKI